MMQDPMVEEDQQATREQIEEKLQTFGTNMAHQRDEWIRSRYSYGVDKRWLEDEDQYNAKDNINQAASQMLSPTRFSYSIFDRYLTFARTTRRFPEAYG